MDTYMYAWLSLFTVHLKVFTHCESATPQDKMLLVLKKIKEKWVVKE